MTEALRILMVAPMPPDRRAPGAIPVVLHSLASALARRHAVTFVTVAGPDRAELKAAEEAALFGIEMHAVPRPQPRGIGKWARRARMAATWLRGRYPWRTIWFAEPEIQTVLNRLASTRRFDVVLVEDNAMGLYRFPAGVPRVLTEHEVRSPRPVDWASVRRNGFVRWAFRELDWCRWPRYHATVSESFDRIQVFTPRDADRLCFLVPHLASRICVTPFGLELPAPADPGLEERGRIVFVGNFTHPPNVDAAIWLGSEIFPKVKALHPSARLTLVGIAPPANVVALAGEHIEVTGPVDDVEPLLERAALLVAPVRIGGGMRMKILHALALGKPVVTTLRGAAGLEIAGEEPPLVVAENTDSLARETATLLANQAVRRSLSQAARVFVERHYSAEAYARRVEATIAELLGLRDEVDARHL